MPCCVCVQVVIGLEAFRGLFWGFKGVCLIQAKSVAGSIIAFADYKSVGFSCVNSCCNIGDK